MRLFELNTDEAIKLKPKSNDDLKKFMDTLHKVTQVHPLDPASRISWDGKSMIEVRPMGDHINIVSIQSLAPAERSGSASALMATAVVIANETGVTLRLSAKPYGTTAGKLNKRQLMAWYKRKGFVPDPSSGAGGMTYTPPVKENITEGLSPVLYHYVSHPANAYKILAQNQFKLSAAPGTESEKALQKGDRYYYLSTTRHKLGGYHLGAYKIGVILNLDGNALSQNYAGKAVDFYGADWYGPGKKGHQEKEAEDRIYSYKPIIPNARKYIKGIHLFYVKEYQETEPRFAIDVRRLAIEAKKAGIPFYFYEDKQAWLKQDTRRAVNPATVDVIRKATGKDVDKRTSFASRKYLAPWVELYKAPVGSQISKKAADVRYNYVLYGYSDAHQSLESDMHNAKQRASDSPGYVELLKIFRKEKIRSAKEYIELLKKKWEPKDES